MRKLLERLEEGRAEPVEVDTRYWEFSSGKAKPSGEGYWMFMFGNVKPLSADFDDLKKKGMAFAFNGTYGEAKKKAIAAAKKVGVTEIHIAP